ncbi:MAG: ATP-binding protein [Dissulfurispiraceae bacterium]|jgi:PAS domain S-box-containing protein|nr:ATP-binding protein [Dissulfurispiraceae bacterium]
MFICFSISSLLLILATWLIIVFGLPYSGYKGSWHIHKAEAFNNLNLIAELKKHELMHHFEQYLQASKTIVSNKTIKQAAPTQETMRVLILFQNIFEDKPDISLLDPVKKNIIISSSDLKHGALPEYIKSMEHIKPDMLHETLVFYKNHSGTIYSILLVPIYDAGVHLPGKGAAAILAIQMDLTDRFDTVLHSVPDMGSTGEVIIISDKKILLAGAKRILPDGSLPKAMEYTASTKSAEYAAAGVDNMLQERDYRGVDVLAAVKYIRITQESGVGLIVKIDKNEILEPIWKSFKYLSFVSLGLLFIFLALAHTASKWISAPIEKLAYTAKQISEGNLRARAQITGKYEIDELGTAFNSLAEKIEQWNRELEDEVTKRTNALLDATTKLNASKERLSLALSTGHIGMYEVDLKTGEMLVNNEYAKMLGYHSAEEFQENISNWKQRLHPLDRDTSVEVYNAFTQKKIPVYETEFRLRSKNGDWVWVLSTGKITECSSSGEPLHMLGTHINITERKKTEQILIERENKYRTLSSRFNILLEANPDVVMVLSVDLKIIWANKAAAQNFESTVNEIIGRTCCEFWHKNESPCIECFIKKSFETGELQDFTVESHDKQIWDIRSVAISDEIGKSNNVIIFARNITNQKKLEEQLLQAQKMEAVGQLAGGIAHDFNNILTGIIGYASLLQLKAADNDAIKSDAALIIHAAERAAEMTKSLLTFSRKQIFNYYTLNLNEIITRTMKIASRLIREDIEITTDFRSDPLYIRADESQIQQVLMNLVTNARDAMPKGGRLLIKTELAELDEEFVRMHSIGSQGSYAVWSVSDTGTGMDEETRRKIFEPFFTTKDVGKGTGLGLSMAYGIIKQHKGHINIYSTPGKGTTFRIYLPIAEKDASAVSKSDLEPAMPFGKGETILIAEDDYALREMTASLLTEFGYRVIVAENGAEAVELFILNKDKINALLFDVTMPRMGGVQAYMEIKKTAPDIRFLFYTGYAKDLISEKDYPFDISKLIQKPVSPHQLLTKIREIIDAKS